MKNKIPLIIVTIGLVIAIIFILVGSPKENKNTVEDKVENKIGSKNLIDKSEMPISNTEIKDGVQYITISAKGGYSPRLTTAKAGIPTKLIIKTDGTYDCSSALVIRSIDYQKILPKTGEEIIDIGTPKAGSFQGMCGMGMYSFEVNFE
jgi:plastocyanin domain-containing protein